MYTKLNQPYFTTASKYYEKVNDLERIRVLFSKEINNRKI